MIPHGQWTVVAESHALWRWSFLEGFDAKTIMAAVDRGDLIAMQKRVGETDFQLLARPTCPAWRKIRRVLASKPLPPRVMGR